MKSIRRSEAISTAQMVALERQSKVQFGVDSLILMENAGRSIAQHILRLPSFKNSCAIILSGPGNNGGDALVAARHLYLAGRKVEVHSYPVKNKNKKLKTNLTYNTHIIKKMKLTQTVNLPGSQLTRKLKDNTFVIDGLFGTGLRRCIESPLDDIIYRVNHSNKMVYSIDIPSGIHSDDGMSMGCHILATYTGSLGYVKQGLIKGDGKKAVGNIVVLPIGLPTQRLKYEY